MKHRFLKKAGVHASVLLITGMALSRVMRIAIASGHSMEPSIRHLQPLVIDCRPKRRQSLKRGDLIAFRLRRKGQPRIFLKRVVGLPGDRVEIRGRSVYLNGRRYQESYLKELPRWSKRQEWQLGEGELFVLGDNRNNSLDSRKLGPIPIKKDVIGAIVRRSHQDASS